MSMPVEETALLYYAFEGISSTEEMPFLLF